MEDWPLLEPKPIRATKIFGSGRVRVRLDRKAFDDISVIKTGTTANLVPNPGFENGDWAETSYAGTTLQRSADPDPHSGTSAYVITNNIVNASLTSGDILVTASKKYKVSAWLRGELANRCAKA